MPRTMSVDSSAVGSICSRTDAVAVRPPSSRWLSSPSTMDTRAAPTPAMSAIIRESWASRRLRKMCCISIGERPKGSASSSSAPPIASKTPSEAAAARAEPSTSVGTDSVPEPSRWYGMSSFSRAAAASITSSGDEPDTRVW